MIFGRPVHEPSKQFDYPTTLRDVAEHLQTRALVDIWQGYESGGGMRMGRDIPSREFGKYLAHIIIVEPVGDWDNSFVRLAGQVLMLRFGRDVTGLRGSEIFNDNPSGYKSLCNASRIATATRKPFFVDSRVVLNGVEQMHLESANLPIFGPNGEPGWMMATMFLF